jgi:hypothetical protein
LAGKIGAPIPGVSGDTAILERVLVTSFRLLNILSPRQTLHLRPRP